MLHNDRLSLWRSRMVYAVVLSLSVTSAGAPQTTSATKPVIAVTDSGWPRDIVSGGTTITVFQPQVDAWDGFHFTGRAAVEVRESSSDAPVYGVVHLSAETAVDRENRMVILDKFTVTSASFTTSTTKGQRWASLLEARSGKLRPLGLDRIEADLVERTSREAASIPVRNDPPRIIIANAPAILIPIDGDAVYSTVAGTSLTRVLNTRPLILRDRSGTHYLKIFDGWMSAESLTGSWTVSESVSADCEKALKWATDAKVADLLVGGGASWDASPAPSLVRDPVPHIYIEVRPAELVVTDGEPRYTAIEGTGLVYAENTTGNLFLDAPAQRAYLVLSGRWFSGPSSLRGPWRFVAGSSLPRDFREIPDASPKENIKASVPGTRQAQEAVVASGVPYMARIRRSDARFAPVLDGEPELRAIEGTSMRAVANSSLPIVVVPRDDTREYYGVQNGVWFVARDITGPWIVATSVPDAIYTIPVTSALHYVTHVRVYDADPEYVVSGYTAGYTGSYVSGGVVVYGTGYGYESWTGAQWWGAPHTYGAGASMTYAPWKGWSVAQGTGWTWTDMTLGIGWGWGPYPWWGPAGSLWSTSYPWVYRPGAGIAWAPRGSAAWGTGYWAGATGSVYSRWGSRVAATRPSGGVEAWTANRWAGQVGASYNSRTGSLAAGQRVTVTNAYTGDYAAVAVAAADSFSQASGGDVALGDARSARAASTGRDPDSAGTADPATGSHVAMALGRNHTFAGADGNVYRRPDDGTWERHTGDGWEPVEHYGSTSTLMRRLEADHEARAWGERRTTGYQRGAFRTASPRSGAARKR